MFDSCVYRYTLSGHYIVIVFISIPMYNSVPKSARRNKLSLNRNQLYIYANVLSALMKRLDECVVSYVEELPEHQYTKIFNSIRLDYPELFFMPKQQQFVTSYNRDKGELKVTIPLEDFAEIQSKEA